MCKSKSLRLSRPVFLVTCLFCTGLALLYLIGHRNDACFGNSDALCSSLSNIPSLNSHAAPRIVGISNGTFIGILNDTRRTIITYTSEGDQFPKFSDKRKHMYEEEGLLTEYGNQITLGKHRGGFYQVGDENIYIYSAFLDTRYKPHCIRMFGMQSQSITPLVGCAFTFRNGTRLDIGVGTTETIYPDWPSPKLQYLAYYCVCKLPERQSIPDDAILDVYVQGSDIRSSVPWMEVGKTPDEDRGMLAVCVKAAWGRLKAGRLVEWIESNRELGVEKIIFYDRTVIGASSRVLRHYSQKGLVEVLPFTYALKMASLMKNDPMKHKLISEDFILEQAYLVSINDCYYRLRDRFKYVLIIDIDEILLPVKFEKLPSLIARARSLAPLASSFVFSMAWHFGEYEESPLSERIPYYMHMQRHLRRTQVMDPAKDQPKAVVDTDGALTLNWHGGVKIPYNNGYLGNLVLKWTEYGFVHHFRDRCRDKYNDQECAFMKHMSQLDDSIPRLINVTQHVKVELTELQLL